MKISKFWNSLMRFFNTTGGTFLLGALVGAIFFGAFFGFSLVNPGYTDWIFYGVTHDTAQHFIGWEFFRADSTGAIINGLAYPVGLPITFMDGIPLFALPLKLIAGILPANFQYFGLWALICYILQGGIAAILVRKIWQKVFAKKLPKNAKILFVCEGNLGRSQIARGFYNSYTKSQNADSAGIMVKNHKFHPNILNLKKVIERCGRPFATIIAMKEKNIDISDAPRMQLASDFLRKYDLVVDLMEQDISRPEWFCGEKVVKWHMDDVAPFEMAQTRKTRDKIEKRIKKLISGEVDDDSPLQKSLWQTLFVAAGTLILVLAPMMIARTLYHPALAGQWLVLLGILLVWDASKFTKVWKSITVWSAMLVGAVLIHPYFLPMLGAMMVIAALKSLSAVKCCEMSVKSRETFVKQWCETKQYFTIFYKICKCLIKIIVPVVLAGITFVLIGGFMLGSGAEIRDLHDKGFNLLSFANPGGYSIIPAFPNASYSPETMMWLGLGVWVMIIMAAILWRGRYKKSFKEFKAKFLEQKARNIAIAVATFGLFVFSIGVRVDLGPIAIFQWQPPDKIYDLWSAFRAAARMAWPFYYATILAAIYWFVRAITLESNLKTVSKSAKSSREISFFQRIEKFARKNSFTMAVILVVIASLIQFIDIWSGDQATARREGFSKIQNVDQPQFAAPEILDLVTTQKHMIVLNKGFRYDIDGFSEIAQAALRHNLTINVGFFARVPEQVFEEQKIWRDKVENDQLSDNDFIKNIFVTTSEDLIQKIAEFNYDIEKRGKFYFIMKGI